MRRTGLGILVVLLVTVRAAATEFPVRLRLLDDRGEVITAPLTVCYQTDLREQCADLASGAEVRPPDDTRSIRVEGRDHGPASFNIQDLTIGDDTYLRARIRRKALLRIDKPPAAPLAVSVYDPRAASFAKPQMLVRDVRPENLKIPAGNSLIALSAGRNAPDLHLVSVQPGADVHVEYKERRGWSLVVRCRGAKDRRPLPTSVVSLESVLGYDIPNRPVGEMKTAEDGIAIFPGLVGRTVNAAVRHPDFLPRTVPGLSNAPGALAFRDVVLEEGGRVRAHVTKGGKAMAGADCRILDVQAPVSGNAPVLYEGKTDRAGVCRTDRIASGSYLLLVRLSEEGRMQREVTIENGSETEEEIAFAAIRVSGKVSRGGEPAPGFKVVLAEVNEALHTAVAVAEETSGKDGTYQVSPGKPGSYAILLFSPAGRKFPVVQKEIVLSEGEAEETVDFSLQGASLHGKVRDEQGNPLSEAVVILRSNAGQIPDLADENGEFEFLTEEKGQGDLKAQKKGYQEAEIQDVPLGESDSPPVVLTLKKEKLFHGRVLTAAGQPVANAWVGALRSVFGDEAIQFDTGRTDAEGRFEVAPVPGVRNRLFFSGPNCPLSFFDPANESGDLELRCQGQPSSLELTLTDAEGGALRNAQVILRQNGVIIPGGLLAHHLEFLGMRAETDAWGCIVIPNLAPGDYDIFLAEAVREGMIEAGSRTGYLATAHLIPLAPTLMGLKTSRRASQ
ncbi:MAG: carboxypeptidase regulatory-like domain-containing protein [Thermoanaerobaculia bacterium]